MTYRSIIFLTTFLTLFPVFAQESTIENAEETFEGRITNVADTPCMDDTTGCRMWSITGLTGSMNSQEFSVSTDLDDGIGITTPVFKKGDRVILQTQVIHGQRVFIMTDVVRRPMLFLLAALFIVAVWLFGGIAAMRSFAGMAASLGVLFFLIIPGILAGYPPLILTFACSILIMILTFLLGHGWNLKTGAAFAGTCVSLFLTTVLASLFGMLTRLSGHADDNMMYLLSDRPELNAQGILLSAVIIGTLAVLDDVTIAQSSAVFELRGANPNWSQRQLYQSACRIGGDHIAAAVNTLILAYASTALPLLLVFMNVEAQESIWTFLNREPIATEIVRTLVGSIGLLAAVPLTTWIATWWAIRTDPCTLPSGGSHHHHH